LARQHLSGVFVKDKVYQVLLVGSQLSREGLKSLLANSVFTPMGEAKTLDEAHRLSCAVHDDEQCPELLLVDFQGRPLDNDGEMLRRIRQDRPRVRIAVLGDPGTLRRLSQICPLEIDGYLLNDMPAVALIHSLHLIVLGQKIFPPNSLAATGMPLTVEKPRPGATNGLPRHNGLSRQNGLTRQDLSRQEEKILGLLLVGSSNKAIARELSIVEATVAVHMRQIFRKVNARNRTEAAIWAMEHGVAHARRAALSEEDRQSPGRTILVVDDDEMLAYATAKHLKQCGYDVITVNGTTSALAVLDSGRHIDLVLADIVMPAGQPNGFAFGRMVRMKRRDIKMVFMTGYRELKVDESEWTGRVFYKPLDFDSLRREIGAMLAA
jgi:two-component system nitrate/nitrite response regulator NarL